MRQTPSWSHAGWCRLIVSAQKSEPYPQDGSTDTSNRILVAMNILLLGTSSDAGTWFEGGRKRHEIAAERLEADFGEPVSVTVKSIWPTEKLPGLVAGWVEEYQPDAIYIRVPAFWFLHRSVPLRAQRLLGRFGPAIGQTGFRMAASRRWGHNRVFRGGRYVLQSTIGGEHDRPRRAHPRLWAINRRDVEDEHVQRSQRAG